MTPDQLNALGAMAQQASVDEAPSKGQLMGGLMGILAGQSATVRMEEGRGPVKQFTDGVANETAPLVKRTKVRCYVNYGVQQLAQLHSIINRSHTKRNLYALYIAIVCYS
jgi:hypothetical protein